MRIEQKREERKREAVNEAKKEVVRWKRDKCRKK
jgi:hypothetical protein